MVAMERMRKLVGECSCLKCEMEIIITKFPKMVITMAPVIKEYIITRTRKERLVGGQVLFPSFGQLDKSSGMYARSMVFYPSIPVQEDVGISSSFFLQMITENFTCHEYSNIRSLLH